MKKLFFAVIAMMAFFVACQKNEIAEPSRDGQVLYATIEDWSSTRTVMDEDNNIRWSEGDQIVGFVNSTLGLKYQVTASSVGQTSASFDEVSSGGLNAGTYLDHIIAYYPYSSAVKVAKSGADYALEVVLPSEQTYAHESFGNGSFPMVAVSQTSNITFRNICGGMKLQLKGAARIASIKVEGKNGEKLSGKATVTAYTDNSKPSIAMDANASASAVLNCGAGILLNEDTATEFVISLPPTKFTKGFAITVTDTNGGTQIIETSKSNEVLRSSLLKMPVVTVEIAATPQEGDYVDEYGINHGQGIEIDGVVWAPVNCGYHATDFKYGKLYQWGRKYGQGYSGSLYDVNGRNIGTYTDSSVPTIEEGGVSVLTGNNKSKGNVFYTSTSDYNYDWVYPQDSKLWNSGTESSPVKTEYDPCPSGWRVPTYAELSELRKKRSCWTTNPSSQVGYWFCGTSAYTSDVPQVFFPSANRRNSSDGFADDRGLRGYYWSSSPRNDYSYFLDFDSGTTNMFYYHRAYGLSVRCVKDETEFIPVVSITVDKSSLSLEVGKTETISATITPSNANHNTAFWYSDNPEVAVVDQNGNVTAITEGTANITAMAGMQSVNCLVTVCEESEKTQYVDLSNSGTANCYIVSEAGTYKFTPTKGNSSESVGTIASAEVLWESFGTDVTPNVGDLVKNVKYEKGVISFETPSAYREGNAVIAAKDANGAILWSWHIWLTDQPESQVYYNNAGTMMDRNLGATSATPGDVGALGLLYQWGRKDPFLGSSSISESVEAKSTITWPSSVQSDSNNGTIAYATQNPITFITRNIANLDWYYTGSFSTDNTRWTSSSDAKSIYDPCPLGWRIPADDGYGVWATAVGSYDTFHDYLYDIDNRGINFFGKYGAASTIWYPSAGYRNFERGNISNVGIRADIWLVYSFTNEMGAMSFDSDGNVAPLWSSYRAHGLSVRCVQE